MNKTATDITTPDLVARHYLRSGDSGEKDIRYYRLSEPYDGVSALVVIALRRGDPLLKQEIFTRAWPLNSTSLLITNMRHLECSIEGVFDHSAVLAKAGYTLMKPEELVSKTYEIDAAAVDAWLSNYRTKSIINKEESLLAAAIEAAKWTPNHGAIYETSKRPPTEKLCGQFVLVWSSGTRSWRANDTRKVAGSDAKYWMLQPPEPFGE